MRFAHIGDVHFRPLARHAEYRATFEEFFVQIKKQNVDAVVIAGDIIHEKTLRITPEIIDVLVWWFTAMADICPVYVTLGNHDGNLANESRQDSISPIIKALNHPNIHLYKKSGTRIINDEIAFNVFSCFDEHGWNTVDPVEDKINIALFHGSVEGAMTDMGFMLEAEVKVNFFDGFDYAFLGDIHKHQFISADHRIAYCGSTVQQNFGESVSGHGFLLWDIESKEDFSVSLIELPNIKPYVTVPWKGTVKKTITEAAKWPDGSRFRISSDKPLKEKDIARINNDLREVKKTNYIVFKCEEHEKGLVATKGVKRNLRDPNVIMKLLREFNDDETFTSTEWDDVEEIIGDYTKTLKSGQLRNVQWGIKRLEFSNLFGYGEDNVIDFEKMSGLTGIFGPNRTGKSSLVAAIMFALFGTPDREVGQSKSQYLINIRKTQCKTQIFFTVSGKDYNIQRTVQRIKRGSKIGVTHKLHFEQMVDGVWVNKNGEKPIDTDNNIRELIGTVDDFQLTAIAAQRDMDRFINHRSTNRKDIVARFRDLTALDEMHKMAHDDLRETKGKLSALSAQNWDALSHTLNEERDQCEFVMRESVEHQEEFREQLAVATAELAKANEKAVVAPVDIALQAAKVVFSETDLQKAIEAREDILEEKKALESSLADKVEQKDSIPVDVHRSQIKQHHELDKAFSEIKLRLEQERKTLVRKEKTVNKLKVVPCGDDFPTCKYIKDAHEEKGKLGDQVDFIASIEEQLKVARDSLDAIDIDKAEVELEQYDELVKWESSLMRDIASISTSKIDSKITRIKETAIKEQEELDRLEACVVNEEEKQRIWGLKVSVDNCKVGIELYDDGRMTAARRIGQIEAEVEKLAADKIQYDEVSSMLHVYERLNFSFSKRGIPSQIIKSELPSLNSEIRKILLGVVDFNIELEVDDESDKLEVYINYGDSRRPIEVCSGMERAIASMAIRVGLLIVSNMPKANVIVLDEAFNSLDPKNIDAVARMFDSLKRWFKTILIVSHDNSIKNIADNQMDIEKKGKDAYIYYA